MRRQEVAAEGSREFCERHVHAPGPSSNHSGDPSAAADCGRTEPGELGLRLLHLFESQRAVGAEVGSLRGKWIQLSNYYKSVVYVPRERNSFARFIEDETSHVQLYSNLVSSTRAINKGVQIGNVSHNKLITNTTALDTYFLRSKARPAITCYRWLSSISSTCTVFCCSSTTVRSNLTSRSPSCEHFPSNRE